MRSDVLECNNLTKKYRKVTVLDGISLRLKKDRIYGVVGCEGSGKTTFMRLIMGLSFPTEGKIELFGDSLERELRNNRKRIGAMVGEPTYNREITGRKNLEIWCKLKGIRDKNIIDKYMMQLGLGTVADRRVKEYDFGMRQRLGIVGALLGDSEFLILDEPFKGISQTGIKEISEILLELQGRTKKTLLISSHTQEVLNLLATDYIILDKGKVVSQFEQDKVVKNYF
ncbi:MAG: ATP-binding cassette domain-containing protein [Cellulosilyticaceae bacterium]